MPNLPFKFDLTKSALAADPEGQKTVYLDGQPALYINLNHPRWADIQRALTPEQHKGGDAAALSPTKRSVRRL